jgi:hypothetical protein
MKKILFIIFFTSSSILAGEWALVGGGNTSRFYDVDSNSMFGYMVGIRRESHLNKYASLHYGVDYQVKGSRVENRVVYFENWYDVANFEWKLGYIEIPILLRIQRPKNSTNRFFISLGITPVIGGRDMIKKELIYRIDGRPNFPHEEADYAVFDGSIRGITLTSSTIDVLLGAGFRKSNVGIEFQVQKNVSGGLDQLHNMVSIDHKFITANILVYYYF